MSVVELNEDHWDCECEHKYIHKKSDRKVCPLCRVCEDDGMPDSHQTEVDEGKDFFTDDRVNVALTLGEVDIIDEALDEHFNDKDLIQYAGDDPIKQNAQRASKKINGIREKLLMKSPDFFPIKIQVWNNRKLTMKGTITSTEENLLNMFNATLKDTYIDSEGNIEIHVNEDLLIYTDIKADKKG